MLPLWTSLSHVERLNVRFLRSVVPAAKLDDFVIKNEPVLQYLKGSRERSDLEDALRDTAGKCEDVPIIIGGEEIRTNDFHYQVMPHNHKKKIAKFHHASAEIVRKAISTATDAQKVWDRTPLSERINIWLKAAELISTKYRMQLNAATMLGQSKTVIQAEIDSAAELVDFFRFNVHAVKEVSKCQLISEDPKVTFNSTRFRGIDGFIAAISPFNFTAIGGNLAYTPALMGNGVVWKPSDTAMLSSYIIFKAVHEAGLPAGIVNFVPADGPVFGEAITTSPLLSGINFTGSVPTFNWLWSRVGLNISKYHNYPRLVGECGGKNYHFVHPSADVTSVVMNTLRAAFEYCGQKCSACSRMYVPESLWPKIKEGLLDNLKQLKVADPMELDAFMGAVIDEKAFKRISSYIEHANNSENLKVIGGGQCDSRTGYFVQPTIVETKNPMDRIMLEEIFGPVLTVYPYKDGDVEETLKLVGSSTPYALTGAVFAEDEQFLKHAFEELKMTAGNFYINDKCTGAVVGQQPFGGGRWSGTNDKAGGPHYVLRWTSPQSVKETFVPLSSWDYPYMK